MRDSRLELSVYEKLERYKRALPFILPVDVEIDGKLLVEIAFILLSIRRFRGQDIRLTGNTIGKFFTSHDKISRVRKALVALGIINPTNGVVNWEMADRFLSTVVEVINENEIRRLVEKARRGKRGRR